MIPKIANYEAIQLRINTVGVHPVFCNPVCAPKSKISSYAVPYNLAARNAGSFWNLLVIHHTCAFRATTTGKYPQFTSIFIEVGIKFSKPEGEVDRGSKTQFDTVASS